MCLKSGFIKYYFVKFEIRQKSIRWDQIETMHILSTILIKQENVQYYIVSFHFNKQKCDIAHTWLKRVPEEMVAPSGTQEILH